MIEILMVLAGIGLFALVLGVGGITFELICRFPILEELMDLAFSNSPLGRDEVQELNRRRKGAK